MNISPTARYLLTAMAAGVAALGAMQASGDLTDLPDWVGIVVAVLSAIFGALNIVPPQVGGTQEGVVNPSITEPPAADVDSFAGQRGESATGYIVLGALLALAVILAIAVL